MLKLTPILLASAGFAAAGAASAQGQGPQNQVESVNTGTQALSIRNVAGGLTQPWGMAFLPDGRMLVTELPGRLRFVAPDGTISAAIEGTPQVFNQGQGGLMDVALDPNFAENRLVYLSYAEPGEGDTAATALGRGRLVENRI